MQEKVTVIISEGTRQRINRIKRLRNTPNISDEELIIRAIGVYWLQAENRGQIGS